MSKLDYDKSDVLLKLANGYELKKGHIVTKLVSNTLR
jgi:hypothetical protein